MSSMRFQRYKHYYLKGCLMGCFGCRWRRYQQSRHQTTLWDQSWFVVLILITIINIMFVYYLAVVVDNDYDNINHKMFYLMGYSYPWHTLTLALFSCILAYLVILTLLGVFHVSLGYEVYLHKIHKALILLITVILIMFLIYLDSNYKRGWYLTYISLQMFGLYLQVAAVIIATILTWVVAGQWVWIEKTGARTGWLIFYMSVMILLYISPICISSPCIGSPHPIPPKPGFMAHRGAAGIAPENTLISFQSALDYKGVMALETDINLSADGVPFLLHDDTLERTTNIKDVFPERVHEDPSNFTWAELKQLNAGLWYLEANPHGTNNRLSEEQRQIYANQSLMKFDDLLKFAIAQNLSVMFDFKPEGAETRDGPVVEKAIKESGIDPAKILWLFTAELNNTAGYTTVLPEPEDPEVMLNKSVYALNVRYDFVTWKEIQTYRDRGIDVNMYVINTQWLYSYCWCAGVKTITTNRLFDLEGMTTPSYTMNKNDFLIIWLTIDVVSLVCVVIIFAFHSYRKRGQLLEPPEMASLQVVRHRISQMRQSKNMKEKLIRAAEGLQETQTGFVGFERDLSNGSLTTPTTEVSAQVMTPDSIAPAPPTGNIPQHEYQEEPPEPSNIISLKDIPVQV